MGQLAMDALVPFLKKNKEDIEKIERKEFKYGQGDRHCVSWSTMSTIRIFVDND